MEWLDHAHALAGQVSHRGSRWYRPIAETPRHALVPAWWERTGGTWQLRRGPIGAAYADRSLVTRVGMLHADHAADDARPTGKPTSSSTQPSLLISMFRYARLAEGLRILDVGTGSGYGTALLCHRYQSPDVTSIDVDPYLTGIAADRLRGLGMHPRIIAGDATAEVPGGFDRIVSTVAVRPIPPAWLAALPLGGRLATVIAGTWIILHAERRRDGVFGELARDWAGFMRARTGTDYPEDAADRAAQREALIAAEGEYVGAGRYPVVDIGEAWELHTMLELEVPGLHHDYTEAPDGRRTALMTHADGSWARADAVGFEPPVVHQSGPRRLWDELDRVRDIWLRQGQAPFLGARAMILEDGTVKIARGDYRATISATG